MPKGMQVIGTNAVPVSPNNVTGTPAPYIQLLVCQKN